MTVPDITHQHFLVEWYQQALSAAPPAQTAARLAAALTAQGATVQLVLVLAAPIDDVVYSVFSADSAETVLTACRDAGCPADRITADIRTYLSG